MTEEQERSKREKYEQEKYAAYIRWRNEEEKARRDRSFHRFIERWLNS